uniref:NADH dehydrogenase subunit 5 n=1 Tax=Drosophila austrosaltans TaxID=72469 RepID=B1PTR9_DROAS|nr:NADH dehydrogenase subunit 5 [Drosophila austrosaltans]
MYSKDMILEMVLISNINMFSFFLYFFSTGLTVSYSFRLVYYSMTGDLNCGSLNMLNDEGWIMLRGMMGLLIMSIVGGSMLNWLIFPYPYMICLPIYMKLLTLFVCIFGGLFGYLISLMKLYNLNKSLLYYKISSFLGSMWFMPYISTYGIIFYPLNYGQVVVKSFDQGWSEYFGGQHLYQKLVKYSQILFFMHNNNLKIYLLLFMFWVLILINFLLFL